MKNRTKSLLIAAAVVTVGSILASDAAAASRFGPAGLGSNLHRRFVVKQAVKRSNAGQPVRNRAITWYAKPYINSRTAWRRW